MSRRFGTISFANSASFLVVVSYSKYPLTVVLTGTNLTQGTPGAANWTAAALAGGATGVAGVTQSEPSDFPVTV